MKKFAAVIAAGVVALGLAGCESSISVETDTENFNAVVSVTLTAEDAAKLAADNPGKEITCDTLPEISRVATVQKLDSQDYSVKNEPVPSGLKCVYEGTKPPVSTPMPVGDTTGRVMFGFNSFAALAIPFKLENSEPTQIKIKVGKEGTSEVFIGDETNLQSYTKPSGGVWETDSDELIKNTEWWVLGQDFIKTQDAEPTIQPDKGAKQPSGDSFPVWVIVLLVVLIPTGLGVLMWKLWPKIKRATEPKNE